MLAAKIDISTRKHGPHSLRHSLAINLFENGESPGVISEIRTFQFINHHELCKS